MKTDNHSLREPQRITSLDELETAKKKATINASQDRLLLTNNLGKIKKDGPAIFIKNVMLPAAAVGIGVLIVGKVVGSIFSSSSDKNSKQYASDIDRTPQIHYVDRSPKKSTVKQLAVYLPVAIKAAKMGVSYMEKNGTKVPQIVHDLLAGPGVSSKQKS